MSTPSDKTEIVVGIDLGTTNSLVAHVDEKTPRVLADEDGNVLVPSVISLADGPYLPAPGPRGRPGPRAREGQQG